MTEDFNPPTVSLTAPAEGASARGLVAVSASAWDDVGVKNVMFYANGVLVGIAWGSPYKILWNTTSIANGPVSLMAYSYDDAGNQSPPSMRQVTVSNNPATAPPAVTISSPADGSTVSGTVVIKGKAEGKSEITRLHITIDGEVLASAGNVSEITAKWDVHQAALGNHIISVLAIDANAHVGAASVAVEK